MRVGSPVLFEPESSNGDSAESRAAGARIAATVTARFGGASNQRPLPNEADNLICIADTLTNNWGRSGNGGGMAERNQVPLASNALTSRQSRPDATAETYIIDEQNAAAVPMVGTLQGEGLVRQNRGFSVFNPHRTLQKDGSVVEGFAERPVVDALHGPTGNKEPLVVASPLTASNGHHGHSSPRGDGSDNLVAHSGVRRLMPVECERLQGFPDGWTCIDDHRQPCDCPDAPRYRALGNAVAVPVVEWILTRLAEAARA